MNPIKQAAAVGILGATLVLAGCGSSGSASSGGPPSSPSSSSPPPSAVRVGAGDDGRTVHVSVGQTIKLRLTNTYWQVAKGQPGAVLHTVGRQTRPAMGHGCVPGQGCGVVTAAFVARHPGRAVIAASRTSCGEALRCSPAQGSYRVRVVVKA